MLVFERIDMKISLLFSDIKDFFSDELNRVFCVVVFFFIVFCLCQYRTEAMTSELKNSSQENNQQVLTEAKKKY